MPTHEEMNGAFRAAARSGKLRVDDRGQIAPVDQIVAAESATTDQAERHAEGSGDGGKGIDPSEGTIRHRRSTDLNDLIREKARGY